MVYYNRSHDFVSHGLLCLLVSPVPKYGEISRAYNGYCILRRGAFCVSGYGLNTKHFNFNE